MTKVLDNIEEIKRVFFHELGHYVVFSLNGIDVKEITLYPCKK